MDFWKKRKFRLRPEQIILLFLLASVISCCAVAVVLQRTPEDPLCETIEEDPCFEDGVFYIYSKRDYLRFMGYVNRAWKVSREEEATAIDAALMADLDMEEDRGYYLSAHSYIKRPILVYNGIFEGNGHTIRWYEGENSQYALFGKLYRDGEIRNLTVASERIAYTAPEGSEGLLAENGYGIGFFCMANYGMIKGCETRGTLCAKGCYVGGIAGINYGRIEDCIKSASVEGTGTGEYGAGGICGKNADTWTESDGDSTVTAAVYDCVNLGTVAGDWQAGGICGKNDGIDTEIVRCGNEGEVSVRYQKVQPYLENEQYEDQKEWWEDAMAGGIAGDTDCGFFSECYNTGRVFIQEEGNGGTCGIAGGAFGNTEIVNCVSLAGAATGHMRHENIMELSSEEMEQWRADNASISYVHNNWQFDLEEAKKKLGIIPLGIYESALTAGRGDVYLCGEFCIRAPQGFVVREVSEYALCMEAGEGAILTDRYGKTAAGWQVWLLRLPDKERVEMNRFLQEAEKLESIYAGASAFSGEDSSLPGALWLTTLDDEEQETDISGIWGCMEEPDWLHPLTFINGWDHHTWITDGRYSFNLYKEELNAKHFVYADKENPDGPRLDNIISLPVKSSGNRENEVKYLLLFTDKNSNYRPDTAFAREVLSRFYYLPYQMEVRWGDSLSGIAERYTGTAGRYEELAAYNGLENTDLILAGQRLTIPEEWLAE